MAAFDLVTREVSRPDGFYQLFSPIYVVEHCVKIIFVLPPLGLQYSLQVPVGFAPFNFRLNWGHVAPFGNHAQPHQRSFRDV